MRTVTTRSAWTLFFVAFLGGAPSAALHAKPGVDAVQCMECNIVDEGIWNQNLVNSTVWGYGRDTDQYYPATVTGVYWNGPFRMINWYDPSTGRSGNDDATKYFSYRNMQNLRNRGIRPPLSQVEAQERTGWLNTCRMAAAAENRLVRFVLLRSCCESTANRRYGPHDVCRFWPSVGPGRPGTRAEAHAIWATS
jgi:hypothetical protein